ncbi:RecA-like DNA recombinase [Microbacterium phage Magritte]|nr:RecA-like DNA recombinase [Microbacterium phage Magritte]
MVAAKSTKGLSPLQELLAKAEKKFDINVGTMATITSEAKRISTGNIAIDAALGGGFPLGRSGEFYGPTQSGKTTLATQCLINTQRIIKLGGSPELGIGPNDVLIYADYEQTMDIDYCVKLGLDPEHPSFQIFQPDTLEQGADFISAAMKTGEVRLAVVDSVAGMVPSAQAEADSVQKSLPAITARLMKTWGQNLNPILRESQGSIIFINHETEVMAMGGPASYGPPPTTTPGGKALKYFASIRLQFRHVKTHKGPYVDPVTNEKKEIPVATDVRVRTIKNKTFPPNREAVVRVRFGTGFDNFWTAMQVLISNKYVTYNSGRYYFHKVIDDIPADWMTREAKETLGVRRPNIHGIDAVFAAADTHTEWRDALIELAKKIVADNAEALKNVVPTTGEVVEEEEGESSEELDDILAAETSGKRRSL